MENRQLLRSLRQLMEVTEVPLAVNPHADWQRHQVDRSMLHYRPVMQWVGLFLFGHGLATFSGRHRNLSLLFPMEQVFEDFVTHSFRRYQKRITKCDRTKVRKKPLAVKIDDRGTSNQRAFMMKPDISLRKGDRCCLHSRRQVEAHRRVGRRPEARHRPRRYVSTLRLR